MFVLYCVKEDMIQCLEPILKNTFRPSHILFQSGFVLMIIWANSYVLRAQTQIYWTSKLHGVLTSNEMNAHAMDTIIPIDRIQHLALDSINQVMYWTTGANKIVRLDLTNPNAREEVIVSVPHLGIEHIALDTENRQLYWTDWRGGQGRIRKVDLTTGDILTLELITGLRHPNGLALDMRGRKIYWSDYITDKIQRANLDGTAVEAIVDTDLVTPEDIALDLGSNKIYWCDQGNNRIERADLSGDNREILVEDIDGCEDITLDLINRTMYWTDHVAGKIQRANIDAPLPLMPEDVLVGINYPNTVIIDLSTSKLYWSEWLGSQIQQVRLGSKEKENFMLGGLSEPNDILVHPKDSKIYWVDKGAKRIQRSDLNGLHIETFSLKGVDTPNHIALDIEGNTMYWTDEGSGKIQRAAIHGSLSPRVEDIVTGLDKPQGIALDTKQGNVYWTDEGTRKIQRTSLNGGVIEDLITNQLLTPNEIELDLTNNKMYWADQRAHKIQRSDLDGLDIQELISHNDGLGLPSDIALDVDNDKIYWVDGFTNKIQKANLDGSAIIDVIDTDSITPLKIALYLIPEDSLYIQGEINACADDIYEYTISVDKASSYEWLIENGTAIGRKDSTAIRVRWAESGTANLSVRALDGLNVIDSAQLTVEVFTLPEPSIQGNFISCAGSVETYTYPQFNVESLISWNITGGVILSGQETGQVEVLWDTGNDAAIQLIESHPIAACENFVNQTVQVVNPFVEITSETPNPQACGGEPIKLIHHTELLVQQYHWYKEGEVDPINDGSFIFVNTPGKYWLEVNTNCGWIRSNDFQLGGSEIYIPDLFSPNGDGVNDRFTICSDSPDHITQIEFNVFDKQGNLVFSGNRIDQLVCKGTSLEQGWDGGNYPTDTYIWTLKVTFEKCGEKQEKGFVRLLR